MESYGVHIVVADIYAKTAGLQSETGKLSIGKMASYEAEYVKQVNNHRSTLRRNLVSIRKEQRSLITQARRRIKVLRKKKFSDQFKEKTPKIANDVIIISDEQTVEETGDNKEELQNVKTQILTDSSKNDVTIVDILEEANTDNDSLSNNAVGEIPSSGISSEDHKTKEVNIYVTNIKRKHMKPSKRATLSIDLDTDSESNKGEMTGDVETMTNLNTMSRLKKTKSSSYMIIPLQKRMSMCDLNQTKLDSLQNITEDENGTRNHEQQKLKKKTINGNHAGTDTPTSTDDIVADANTNEKHILHDNNSNKSEKNYNSILKNNENDSGNVRRKVVSHYIMSPKPMHLKSEVKHENTINGKIKSPEDMGVAKSIPKRTKQNKPVSFLDLIRLQQNFRARSRLFDKIEHTFRQRIERVEEDLVKRMERAKKNNPPIQVSHQRGKRRNNTTDDRDQPDGVPHSAVAMETRSIGSIRSGRDSNHRERFLPPIETNKRNRKGVESSPICGTEVIVTPNGNVPTESRTSINRGSHNEMRAQRRTSKDHNQGALKLDLELHKARSLLQPDENKSITAWQRVIRKVRLARSFQTALTSSHEA